MAGYEMILTETQGRVAVIRLNRPKALNALCDQLMEELGQALRGFDADPDIAAIVGVSPLRNVSHLESNCKVVEWKDRQCRHLPRPRP